MVARVARDNVVALGENQEPRADGATASVFSRREILAAAAGSLLASASAADQRDREAFAFPLLGDLHFDRLEHHDMEWLAREKPNDVHQVQNYSRLTRERLPQLFEEIRATVAGSETRVPFVLHIGDFVEGLCGNPELARRHCDEAVAFVREARLGVPFLMTKGNHDVTGPGAVEAFNDVLLPWQGREVGQELRNASFTFRHGDAEFVVFDAYNRDSLAWLEKELERRTSRHLFVMIHPPVVPYAARSRWHLYAHPKQQAERERLLELLGRHRAIVLCGHLHKYGIVSRKSKGGRFVQVAISSVIPSPDSAPQQVRSGLQDYGPDLVTLEPRFQPETVADRREALTAEAPFIRHFEYTDTAGYAVINVSRERVTAEIYTGLGRRRWKTVDLTALL